LCPLGSGPTHTAAFAAVGAGEGIVMSRWQAIAVGAFIAGSLVLAGCAGAAPAAVHQPTATPVSGGASPAALMYLQSSQLVPFTGDTVTLRVQAAAGPGSPQWLRLARAKVALGDGTAATVTGPCAGASLLSPSAGLVVRHSYRQPGVVSAHVTAATLCGRAGTVHGSGLAGASVSLRVLAAAPAASASWPPCSTRQLTMTAAGTGAGLGHVGVLFTLRNTSSASCRLVGYPGLELLSSNGQELPTTVVRAASGAYLFPAVVPHRVALPPGAVGSFDLQYGDTPVGAAANEPYATACPAATRAEVTLPGAAGHAVVPASMAPCSGQVLVSPVVPGAQWLTP
jgi:hypothetical protein